MANFLNLFRKKSTAATPIEFSGPFPWALATRRANSDQYDITLDWFDLLPEDEDAIKAWAEESQAHPIVLNYAIQSRTATVVEYDELTASCTDESTLNEYRKKVTDLIAMRGQEFNASANAHTAQILAEMEKRDTLSLDNFVTWLPMNDRDEFVGKVENFTVSVNDDKVIRSFARAGLIISCQYGPTGNGILFYDSLSFSSPNASDVNDFAMKLNGLLSMRYEEDEQERTKNVQKTLSDLKAYQAQQ
jgi:hypothetical protein